MTGEQITVVAWALRGDFARKKIEARASAVHDGWWCILVQSIIRLEIEKPCVGAETTSVVDIREIQSETVKRVDGGLRRSLVPKNENVQTRKNHTLEEKEKEKKEFKSKNRKKKKGSRYAQVKKKEKIGSNNERSKRRKQT